MTIGEQLNASADCLNALLAYANQKTGKSDADIGTAIRTLSEGYGQGGSETLVQTFKLKNATNMFDSMVGLPEMILTMTECESFQEMFQWARFKKNNSSVVLNISENCKSLNKTFFYTTYVNNITINGSTKNVTNFYGFLLGANAYVTGTPIDLTSASNLYTWLGNASNGTRHIIVKPNTRTLVSSEEGVGASLDDESIVSLANSLVATSETKNLRWERAAAKLDSIVGNTVDTTDDTGAYDLFVPNDTGTLTLRDFITSVKGWTIS